MLTRQPKGNPPHRGSIINIASLVSFQGGLNVPAYAAAKGGVAQLTKSLSNQWAAQGINVNAVSTHSRNLKDYRLLTFTDCSGVHSYGTSSMLEVFVGRYSCGQVLTPCR